MNSLPTGTVTFLFTDIEASTKLAQQYPHEMPSLLARHNEILNEAIQKHNGYVFQIVGDSVSAGFHSASDALNAALDAQRTLQTSEFLENSEVSVRVRMGIHTGAAEWKSNLKEVHYEGYTTLALTQRIMSAGHGGQVLVSNATQQLVRDGLPDGSTLRDMGERRLKDLIRPEHLYQLVIPNLPADFPPLKTLDIYRHNLPTQLTSFIGRENEISEITKLIAKHRVLTLTGSGGAGKTRLSLQVGAECLEQFPNGVWFVELASLTEPSLIVGAVMSVLGWHEKDNDIHALAKYIGGQSLLLILDNCEHLIEDCARLTENLIQACPKLHVLASSREAFGIAGEHPYRVPSLPFPDPKHLPTLDEIATSESVQLFIERVKIFVPSFKLTEKNAASVAQICCRLDGIPLAIELAAARVKVMSVEQMASRLGDIFNLLTSGSRTALPRQQTLRALIEWSYDLLSDSEKNLFRRLAAFSGGWSLEAAESVGGVGQNAVLSSSKDGILPHSILDDLARLVDKSLVVKEEYDGKARFHMLETIRQYAEFKMFASEEVDDVKNRHRDWFLQLAETAEPKLRTGEQLTWLNQLELEHDNLRAAMTWSIEQKHIEQALRIPSALVYFWEIRGHEEEGRKWFKQVLTLDDGAKMKYPFAWATAMHGNFSLSWFLLDYQSFRPDLENALKIFREHADNFRTGHTLYHLAYIPQFSGELDTAKSIFEESIGVYRKINDEWGVANCLHCIAHIVEEQGAVEKAQELFDQSLELLKPVGDRWSLYHPVGDTARLAANHGQWNEANAIYQESLQAFEELGNRGWVSLTLRQLAKIHYYQGDYAHAIQLAEQSLNIAQAANDQAEQGWAYFRIGQILWGQGRLAQAHQSLVSAVRMIEKKDIKRNIAIIRCFAGMTECFADQPARGRETMEREIEFLRKDSPSDVPDVLPWLGHVLWLEKDIPRAQNIYGEAITGAYELRYLIKIPESLEGLGKIAVTQNDFERAARLFGAAEAMREKMGTPIPPVLREEYDAHVQSLGTAFEKSWSDGRTMTMEQVIEYTVEEKDE